MTFKPNQGHFSHLEFLEAAPSLPAPISNWSPKFCLFKFFTDRLSALVALPAVLLIAVALFFLNPLFNRGPVFFSQDRMGMGGKKFRMWKFRSKNEAPEAARAHNPPVENHRITPLGQVLIK